MKNRLIPLRERWKELQSGSNEYQTILGMVSKYNQYVDFTCQNLSEPYYIDGVKCHSLNRFVPTDLKGNILEDPNSSFNLISKTIELEVKQYTEAKNRVLFDGWEYDKDGYLYHKDSDTSTNIETLLVNLDRTIEDLCLWGLSLTPTGAKMCGRG